MSRPWAIPKKYSEGEWAAELARRAAEEQGEQGQAGHVSEAETERPGSEGSVTSSHSPERAGRPEEVVVVHQAGAGNLVVASSSSSSGRQSPAALPGPGPGMLHGFPYHARAWASMGPDVMERLKRVAVGLRLQWEGCQHSRTPVDACELHIAWDKMVRAVNCDGDLACLFDTGRVSSDSD